jgi:dephospho-CoA kinase
VVGLTGGIATGKSTVSLLLKSHEFPIVDADVLARQVVAPGTPGLRAVVKTFGEDVLLPDGSLDRKRLGEKIFSDEKLRRKLNAIIHPRVRWGMFKAIMSCWLRGNKVCIVDVPLLVESKLTKWVGFVIVVYWCVSWGLICGLIHSPGAVLRRRNCDDYKNATIPPWRLHKPESRPSCL